MARVIEATIDLAVIGAFLAVVWVWAAIATGAA